MKGISMESTGQGFLYRFMVTRLHVPGVAVSKWVVNNIVGVCGFEFERLFLSSNFSGGSQSGGMKRVGALVSCFTASHCFFLMFKLLLNLSVHLWIRVVSDLRIHVR